MGKKKGKKKNKAGGRGGSSAGAGSKASAAMTSDTPKIVNEEVAIDRPSTEIDHDDVSVENKRDKDKPQDEVDITKESVEVNEATCVDKEEMNSHHVDSCSNGVASGDVKDKAEPQIEKEVVIVNNETTNLNNVNEHTGDKFGYSDDNNDVVAAVEDVTVDETVLPSTNEAGINNTNEADINNTNETDINANDIGSNESVRKDVEKEPDQIDEEESSEEVGSLKEVGSIEIDNDLKSSSQSISMPSPGITKDKDSRKILEPYESFSDGDSTSPPRSLRTQSSRLNSQELEEVDLDSSIDTKGTETSAPLVRAYNGTLNGISPASNNSLSFTFKDSTESEAFAFLTKSLRESLGEDAKDVSDDTLSRYIRYKPDVKRATDRFRAYHKFRKENSYIFDDKPLLLSQDPKLMFLAQNGFVIAPEELFAIDGSGVMIIKGAKCEVGSPHGCDDQDVSRAIFYILQRMMDRSTLDPLKGITIILDLSGSVRKNLPKKLSGLLSKAVGCIPVRIKAIHVLSMPWWYPAAGNKKLFTIKMRSRIHILKNKVDLHEYIEKDRLPEEYGGIYAFDLQAWISSTVLNEVEGTS